MSKKQSTSVVTSRKHGPGAVISGKQSSRMHVHAVISWKQAWPKCSISGKQGTLGDMMIRKHGIYVVRDEHVERQKQKYFCFCALLSKKHGHTCAMIVSRNEAWPIFARVDDDCKAWHMCRDEQATRPTRSSSPSAR